MSEVVAFPPALAQRVEAAGVIAVLILKDAASAVPLAQALLAGGVTAMELTLRTPTALDALRAIRAEVPEMVAGIGTVLTPQQVAAAVEAGATFAVSPGLNPRVVGAAMDAGLPFAPGVCTPSDIELAVELGCRTLKFFPAEPSGGLAYLNSVAAPFAHLGVRYIPLGGVGPKNLGDYLGTQSVLAVGGSWLAPSDLVEAQDWSSVRQRAEQACEQIRTIRKTNA